ncbi:integrase [Gossypium australe]|uniref:Integrase n=1 Tax=Gossypium australe TaxID=47621 RepID=A0A5B6VN08_9ROSI|nr:integrase [Gossypium australe]
MISVSASKSRASSFVRITTARDDFGMEWERVIMYFVSELPLNLNKRDNQDNSLERLAELYISMVVWLHGMPLSIISDRDARFTSRFWGKLNEAFAMKLHFITTFHP